jgi:hypothetical protein
LGLHRSEVFDFLQLCRTDRDAQESINRRQEPVDGANHERFSNPLDLRDLSIASLYSTFQLSPENTPSVKIAGFIAPTAEQLT